MLRSHRLVARAEELLLACGLSTVLSACGDPPLDCGPTQLVACDVTGERCFCAETCDYPDPFGCFPGTVCQADVCHDPRFPECAIEGEACGAPGECCAPGACVGGTCCDLGLGTAGGSAGCEAP